MRLANTLIIASACLLTVSCGSSDDNSGHNSGNVGGNAGIGGNAGTGGNANVGGNGSVGGNANVGGNASTGGSAANNGTGNCNVPSCLSTYASTCVPSGTCVTQLDLQTFASNTCYSNGIKFITTVDLTTNSVISTIKNGSIVCYSIFVDGTDTGVMTLKNASGATVATLSSDAAGNDVVTCTGEQPVVLDSSCANESPIGSTDTTECTDGTCAP